MTDLLEVSNETLVVIEDTTIGAVLVTADAPDIVEIGYVSGGFIPVPGPQGPVGPQGPPGTLAELEVQIASPALSWTTTHALGRHPLVVTVDTNGDEIGGDVHTTVTTVTVDWSVAVAGTLRLY